MKYKFGKSSITRKETIDQRLSYVLEKALSLGLIDFSILCGVRSEEEQNECFKNKTSKCKWPESKHNAKEGELSLAVDVAPYVGGKVSENYNHCCFLAGIITGLGKQSGYDIRWGGNWDMDGEPITDQDFQDLYHYELIRHS